MFHLFTWLHWCCLRFFTVKLYTIFSFVVGKYHGVDTLGPCKSNFYSNLHPLENFLCNIYYFGINANAGFLVSFFHLHLLIRILLSGRAEQEGQQDRQ